MENFVGCAKGFDEGLKAVAGNSTGESNGRCTYRMNVVYSIGERGPLCCTRYIVGGCGVE